MSGIFGSTIMQGNGGRKTSESFPLTTYPRLRLKPGKDRPLCQHHPWVFSGAVAQSDACDDGALIDVVSADGAFLGRGYINRKSQIVARLLTWRDETVDTTFFRTRIRRAMSVRRSLGLAFNASTATDITAFRLINAEADSLPGLIVDAYGPWLVVQILTLGMERCSAEMVTALDAELTPRGIYQRSDAEVRAHEGLPLVTGSLAGETPPPLVEIGERQVRFLVDVRQGQKTGFFLDQRENREHLAATAAHLARGQLTPLRVLNAFCYTGGFGVAIARAVPGAQITNLDASADALELARHNYQINLGADAAVKGDIQYDCGNAFELLRHYRDAARQFDLIILDPPKFAATHSQVAKACRGYKDLNLLAIKLLRPGGLLATFSCSGAISPELFQKIVFGAALDAGRDAQVLARFAPGSDHPLLLSFPEGEYLKGLLVCAQ